MSQALWRGAINVSPRWASQEATLIDSDQINLEWRDWAEATTTRPG